MPKKPDEFIDWEKTPQIKPDEGAPLEKNEKGKGEQAIINQLANLVRKFDGSADPGPSMRQATNEEQIAFLKRLNPDLANSEEELEKKEEEWKNSLNDWYKEVQKPIEKQSAEKDWGSRGPIDQETMTEEEERIAQIPVDPRLTESD